MERLIYESEIHNKKYCNIKGITFVRFFIRLFNSYYRTSFFANWAWAIISTMLLILHLNNATIPGRTFLILQIFVVGGLTFLEENQLMRTSDKKVLVKVLPDL